MWTLKGKINFLLTVSLFLIAWNTGIELVYYLSFVSASISIFSWILAQFSLGKVSCSRIIKGIVFEDDTLNVKLSLKNDGFLPKYYLQLIDSFPAGYPTKTRPSFLLTTLKVKSTLSWFYSAECFKRGVYKIGPCKLIGSDPLGLFFRRRELRAISRLLVYPKIFKIERLPLALTGGAAPWFGIDTARVSGDDSEFYGIREYRRGDPINRIHWRSTARLGGLVAKQFERYTVYGTTIVLDLKKENEIGEGRETTLEYAVKIAASITNYLNKMGALVQLIAYGEESVVLPFNKGESHLSRILETLAIVRANGKKDLSKVLYEIGPLISTKSALAVIMLDTDREALGSLMQFKARGISILPFILVSSTFTPKKREVMNDRLREEADRPWILPGLGIKAYPICRGDDLEKKFKKLIV